MAKNDDIKWLYGKLKAKGYNIGSEEDFSNSLANEADRKWYYEKATGMGLNIGSMDDFNALYAPKSVPNQTPDVKAPSSQLSNVPSPEIATIPAPKTPAEPAKKEVSGPASTIMGRRIGDVDWNAMNQPRVSLEDIPSRSASPIPGQESGNDTEGRTPSAPEQQGQSYLNLSPQEEADLYANLEWNRQIAHDLVTDTNERLGREGSARAQNALRVRRNNIGMNATPYKIGEKANVIQTGRKLNTKTGKVEQTFMTEAGSEYKQRAIADLEQGNIDDARERELDPINTSLRDAYSERDRIDAAMKQRMKEIDEENSGVGSVLRQFVESSRQPGMTNSMQVYQMDDRYRLLEAAARKNRAAIQTLEDKRDGKMNDFFHSIKTTALNSYTFTDGLAEINDAIALMDAQQHIQSINAKRQAGEPLNSEEVLAEIVLRNDAFNNAVQGRYAQEYGSWATAGQMIPTSMDLMKDIMLTPGAGSIAKGIAGKVSNLGGKYLAKQAGDAATKSIAKKVGRGILKGTGVLLGAHTAGAVISNTSGINRTAAVMGTNMAGHTAVDENGYKVEDDMGVLEAFADAERQMMRENGSEMFGEFIPGAGKFVKKGLEKMGLSKISAALTRIGNKQWYKQYNALLEAGGYNGIAGEGIEEYEGILFDALTGHAGEALDQIKDPRTHVDIWLGTAAMSAMMGAVPVTIQGFHTGQYYRYKHNTDNSDKLAAFRLGEDRWAPMRDRIDGTPNEGMADVAAGIINDESLRAEEKLAALKYIRNLTKMRGYNIGQMSNAKEESKESREANESYADGYNAETNEEKQDTKNLYVLRRQKVVERFSAEGLARVDNDPMRALNELGADEASRQIILDYVNSKQAYDGMIQRVRDDLDSRIEQSNAMVDARTNQTTGMVQGATMKQDDRKVYVLAGELIPYDDGSGIDISASSQTIIVRDATTGELEQVAPDSFLSVDEPQDANEQKNVAAEAIRQQYGNAAADVIDGIVTFHQGATFSVMGQDGQSHQIQIVANEQGVVDNGDGTVNVSDGTSIFAVQKDFIQQQVNEQNQARVAEAERQREQELAAARQQAWEANRPQYAYDDDLVLRDADGNLIHGKIAAVEEADGIYVVDVDHPINGNFAPNLTREQIDDMIVEYNGQPMQKQQEPASQNEQQGVQPVSQQAGQQMPQGQQGGQEQQSSMGQQPDTQQAQSVGVPSGRYSSNLEAIRNASADELMKAEGTSYTEYGVDYNRSHLDEYKTEIANKISATAEYLNGKLSTVAYLQSLGYATGEKSWLNSATDEELHQKAEERAASFMSFIQDNQSAHNSVSGTDIPQMNIAGSSEQGDNGSAVGIMGSAAESDVIGSHAGVTEFTGNPGTIGEVANQQPSAFERIPKDEQGNPLYEQAETPDVAWDAIVEQTGGDEDMATEIISDIIKEQEAASTKAQKALKKVQEAKPESRKDGVAPTMAERIAAKKAAKEALASAQAEVDRTNTVLSVWQQIARTPQRRKNAEEERKRREDAERKRQEAEAVAAQKAEQEEAARIEREALNGVPDIINDTPQDARARGYRRVNGHKVNRQEPLLPIPGRDVSIKFSDDEISSGKVVAIDAAQLQPSHRQGRRNPSHFIDEAQPKERNDEASILSAEKIAGSIRPEEITSSVTAYTGAPTVNSRGEVIQGNNRSAALRSMWESYPEQAAIYKQYLVDHAKDFGLNAADVASMERPVLVNMLDVPDEEAIKLGQYVAQDTESGGTERIKPKNALQKMGRDVKSFANILLQSADEELSFSELVDRNGIDTLKWMNTRGYITPTQYQSAFDTKGNITAESKNDLKGILYQGVFSGGNTQLEEMFGELPAKAQKAILATAFRDFDSAESERMITEIQDSIRAYHALLQDKRFREAKNYKEARLAVEGWKQQYQMDDVSGETYLPSDNFTNFALHLATIYKGESQTFIQSIFNRLYDLIQGTQEATLFEQPDNTPRTLAQAIYEVLNIQYDGQHGSNVLAGGSAAGQQRRQGSGGSAPAGERIEDGTEPADGTGGAEGSGRQGEVTPSLFQYFTGTLSELIAQAKQSAQGLIKKVIAPISSRLKDDLNNQGLQVDDNYNHVIDNNAIRHTLKKHSGKNEGKRGQIPITDADFENIRDVVEHYDGVEVVPGNTSAQRIIYHKTYQDGTVIFVEEQRVGRKELAAVTMWKKRNPSLTDANRTETTLISDLTEVSDYKDTTNRQNANELGENFDDAKRNDTFNRITKLLFKDGRQETQVQARTADGRATEIYEGANGGGQKYEGTQGDTEGQTGGSLYIDGRQGEVPGDGLAGESWSDGSRKDDRGEVSGLPEEGTRNVSGGRASEGASGTEGFIRVAAPEDLSESPEEANAGRMDEIAERLSEIDYRLSELEEQGGMFNEAERISLNLEKSELEQEYDGLRQINEQSRAIQEAEAETNADPTEAQKKAGNYKKGHLKIDGYDVTIENPKGSQRSGTDQDGSIWSVTMNNTYGYIRGTEGVDGDHIDVFLSDNPSQGNVYVVDQVNQQTGEFDEHKVMYGFNSAEEAQEAYLANYSEGWKMGTITEVSKEEFKKWIQSSHRKTKPFAEYKGVKKVGVSEKENTTGEKDVTGGPVFPNAGSNASQPVSLESWRQMDSDGRMTEAEKRPLTREEIENAPTDEVLRANALDFLNGDRGMISSISYLKVYEDVRYSNGDSAADSGAADRTQLDETDTGSQQGLDGASGGSRRVSSELLDSEQGEGTLPGPEGYVQHSPDSEERDASGAGERGNSDVSGEEQSVGGRSVRGGERRGSRSSGSHGRNGERGRVERSDQSAGNDRERRAEARRGRNSRDGGSQSIGEDIGSFIADAMKEFDSVLDEFKRAGSEDLSVSIIGLNSRQLEVLPRLISAGAKVGYAYVKNGIHEFAEWARQMRKVLGGKLSDAGLGENEIDAYIHEMWKCKLPMDGETHTIEEWAGILGKEALRKKMGQTFEDKRKAQQAAEKVAVKLCNRENISETLPFLLPQQQEDVLKAETQFFDESHNDRDHAFGKGYMFTNGTGTGKTYTGLGIVKRFMKLGRGRVLILTPSQTKVGDWIKDAANLDIELNDLDAVAKARKDGTTATTEKGEGAVITTYANFRQNRALLEDRFDLIVYDESHRLLENKGGIGTTGAMQHYKISNRNEQFAFLRLQEINPVWNEYRTKSDEFETKRSALIERLKKESGITNELTFDQRGQLPPVFNGNWTSAMEHKFPELAEIRKDALTLNSKFEKEIKPELERQAKDAVKHTKVVFLSATPFNTRENLDYAEGYIFSYPESERPDGYSVQSPRSQFYLEHFGAGYKWRYHRLESTGSNPEAVSKQEVAFSDYLQHTLQTMSGRIIDSPFDYSRDFPTVTLGKADEFNNAMEELSREEATRDSYYGVMGDYNYTSALFESMKVAQIIPRLKDHLVRGRKIVVFHRRVESKNPLIPPFKAIFDGAADALEGEYDATKKAEKKKKIAALRRKYAGMLEWEQTLDLRMPREQLADAFGKDGVLFFSGKESKRTKDKAVADFNSDTSGKNIIVIQESSGKEGISLHDTTGNHQRVLVTLALPQSPITALQIEGRIYRIGNKSNAIFEYPLLGLNTELMLFGQKFNQQVSTTENLALGSQARNLRESFARGVEEHSGDVDLDSQGVGGKEFDAAKPTESDAFDGAVLDYYTNQRLTGKRDSREGIDYYPTPEPLGFMMSQWGHIGEGESVLEPSAGHGAIARYVPKENPLTAIEPSQSLFSKLQIKAGGNGRKFENTIFENYNVVNKHDVVLMNPPFGTGGRIAVDHVAKAFQHLEEGGRIVAIIPRGSTDKKFAKWYEEQKGAVLSAEIVLPDITFERAGTSVNCRVVVIDKVTNEALRSSAVSRATHIDLSGKHYEKIEDFFDEIRDIDVPVRTIDHKARLKKKAAPVARELRTVKGIKYVDLEADRIYVSGNDVWAEIKWGDMKGEELTSYLADRYKTFKNHQDYAAQNGRETQEAAYGELKALSCKLAGMTEDEMQRYISRRDDDVLFRSDDALEEVNERFNEELDKFSIEEADKIYFDLGSPSEILLSAGVADKPMKLYGNKVIKKMKKHGFKLEELRDLPKAVANPIAVFDNYNEEGNRSILTELRTEQGNFLVSVSVRKDADVDFNIVRSVFGKGDNNVIGWINKGFATYIDKEKALSILSHQSAPIAATAANAGLENSKRLRLSAPIAEASNSQELSSATKIVESFENPSISEENLRKGTLFRVDETITREEEANRRFNEELQRQIDGTLPKGHVYRLGNPSEVLLAAGLPDLPVELAASRLSLKSSSGYESNHPFELESVMDLPKAIQHPIAVFDSKTRVGSKVILIELQDKKGNNFVVAMNTNVPKRQYSRASIQINDIRSVYPKDNAQDVVNWITRGDLLRYVDKKKIEEWITQQRSNSAEVEIQNLDIAAKIVESFENPRISEENLRKGTGFVSNSELSLANDPMARVIGRKRIGSRQQAFADRERERMVDRVQQLAKKLHLDNVEIVTEAGTLEGKRSKAKGFYSPKTGKITIVIPNHTSVSDAVVTLLHEAVAHYGLRQMFGEHFNTFLDNVFKNADESIRNKIIDLAKKHGWDFHTATEEYLAGLAEQTNFDAALSSGWWNKIKTLFLEMLRKIGFEGFGGVTLTDNELRYILWRSYENLAEPGRFRNILGQAADIAKQYELKVGDYASKPLPTDIKVSEADELEAVNEKFNEDLKRYKNGEMDKNEMFHLGYPRGVMQLFLPNFPIVMRQRVVKKGSEKKHDVPLHAISDMPSMISDPIFVFQRDANNIGILTDMTDNDGKNVCVAIELGKTIQNGKEYLEVNDIRSFHGRDVKYIVEPIVYNNTLRYANKSKGLTWLSSASQPVQQEIDKQDLLSATNIVRNFENPNGADEKDLLYRDGDPEVSDEKDEDPDKMDAIVSAREIYEEAVKDTGEDCLVKALFKSLTNGREYRVRFKNKFAESHFDYTRSVEKLQEAIEKATGRPIQSFENTWQALNFKNPVDSIELQRVKSLYIDPLFEHVGRMIKGKKMNGRQITADDVEIYLNALHGPERNQYMGERDAEAIAIRKNGGYREEPRDPEDPDYDLRHEQWKEWRKAVDKKKADLLAHRKDYSGLTALFGDQVEDKKDVEQLEAAADRYCHEFEAAIGDVGMIEELKQKVRDLNHWSVKKAYLSGLISKDLYDQTLSMYDNYVPLRGWHDDYAGDVYGYISNGADKDVQGVMKRAYGRKSRAAHIFGTMAAMANTAIVQGNKNIVAQKFFNCAQNHADSGLLLVSKQWYQEMADGSLKALNPTLHNGMSAEEMREEIERHDAEMKHQSAKKETGVKLYTNRFDKHFPMKMAKWEQKQHSVRVMRNGVEYQVYVLGNPRAAQAINGLLVRDTQVGAIGKFIMKVMRFRAAVQTKYNAEFPISNFERDVYTSAMSMFIKYGGQYKGKGITRKFLNNLRKVMPLGQNPVKSNLNGGGIFTLLNRYRKGTLDQNDPMQRLFAEFCDHGGVTGISNLYNEEQFDDQMKSTILRIRHKGLDIPMKAAESFFGAVGFVNSGIENATRFATYMTLREAGANVSDSIFAAKEASVNFNRKGSGAWLNLWMRRYILYSNVALQALRMLGTWHDANKKRFYSVMAANVLASYTTAMLYHLVGQLWGDDDDDDGEKESDWYHLSEWNRYNYINLKNPVGNGYFHYSIPQEFRPAWALGQIIYDWQAGRVSEKQATLSMLTQVNNLAPMAFIAGDTDSKDGFIDGFIKAWMPTLAEDFIDVYHWNEDFLGRPITNQYDWNEMEPEWQRAGEETPQWAISLSRKWNAATGGADHRRGISESKYLNPSALYYLLEQQAGGVGTMATKITRAVEQWQDPELELELKNIPFVSKFWVGTADDYSKNRVLNDRFYFYWNEFNAIDHDISATRSDFRNDEISEEEYDKHMQELEESGDLEFWYHMKGYSEYYNYLLKLSREGDKEASAELLELKKEVVSTLEKEKAGQAE